MKRCLLCHSSELYFPTNKEKLMSVTSDCKPWDRRVTVFMCKKCGHIQKDTSTVWSQDVEKIYADYAMYPLSMGNEQLKFGDSGQGDFRSSVLLDKLFNYIYIHNSGKILDIGCGNGSLLDQFHIRRPMWQLSGHEQGGREDALIPLMKGKTLYTGELADIDEKFDIVVLLHVLEHVTDPVQFLKTVKKMLSSDGYLVVQCPNFQESPFDLTVYDHCSSYTRDSLKLAAKKSGFSITSTTEGWIAKEIGFIAAAVDREDSNVDYEVNLQSLDDALDWLSKFLEKLKRKAYGNCTGIFGTAVAGTWLARSLGEGISFFAEEDALQHGNTHLGLPILSPQNVPYGATVLMGFIPVIAKGIVDRLKKDRPDINFVLADV